MVRKYNCGVEALIDVAGGKWKPLIIYHLLSEKKRFNELKRLIEGITSRALTLQLRELETCGVISRTIYPEVPPRVEYSLTEFGKTLEPVLLVMKGWGDDYLTRVESSDK